ncbi:MAG TPA: GDSL-type esterase/lipase family protein [Chitinophagaceae bacterium]|nr:GDSL-type esterase/lipase family protein [Chitinophagaceae bacterium]
MNVRINILLPVVLHMTLISSAQVSKIRIACIGNSITAGARVSNPELYAYPAVLSSILYENGYAHYDVKNFGIGGATMIRFGKPNLWRLLDSMVLFSPDVVIIKAGTNETVSAPRYNWEHIGDFEKDYADYIDSIKKINPNCRFIICSPLDMVIKTDGLSPERKNDLSQRRPLIWQLRKRIRKIAKKEDTYFLDLTKPFKGKSSLMTTADGVHPNKDGYRYLATLVFDFMVKKGIVVK